jgi:hypothetical protein
LQLPAADPGVIVNVVALVPEPGLSVAMLLLEQVLASNVKRPV